MIRVRHILITPAGSSAEADEAARQRATELLERARAGEDFAALARRYSNDVASKEKGGDLGSFTHGAMLEAFEAAAFRLRPGDLSDVVKTEVGYHVILCLEHEPLHARDLRYVYANVGWDAASEKGDSLVARRADSLAATVRTVAQASAAAQKLGLILDPSTHEIGDRKGSAELVSFHVRLENTPVGKMVPGTFKDMSGARMLAWVDSVAPGRIREWEQARLSAVEAYRRGGSQRALDRKRAELDSLLARGLTSDSVAAGFGGFERVTDLAPGKGLSGMSGSSVTDSLIFGVGTRPPALAIGRESGWIELPGGWVRLRVRDRSSGDPGRLAALVENQKRMELERKLYGYFDGMRSRYAVRILDPTLRDTPLPPPPEARP
jgi:hypothetical protein